MTLPTLSVVRKTKEATNSTKGGDFLVSLYVVLIQHVNYWSLNVLQYHVCDFRKAERWAVAAVAAPTHSGMFNLSRH